MRSHDLLVAAAAVEQLHPLLDQQHPVVGGRRVPVRLGDARAGRQPEQSGVRHPQGRVGELGIGGLREAVVEPAEEAGGAVRRVGQRRGQLGEPLALLGQPVGLARGRGGEPGELRERRQVALAHHGRDARGEQRRPEQLVDQCLLVLGQGARWGRGEPEHEGVRQLVEHFLEQPAPHLEQVVTLVEHQGEVADLLEPLDEGSAVGVEPVEKRLGVARAVVVDGVVVVERRQRLVRQRGERPVDLPRGAGRGRLQGVPATQPLRLDRGVRAEHDRGAPPAPCGLQPDEGLSGPGRQHDPGATSAGRPRPARSPRAPRAGGPAATGWAGATVRRLPRAAPPCPNHPIRPRCRGGYPQKDRAEWSANAVKGRLTA